MGLGSGIKRFYKEWMPSIFWAFIAWLCLRTFFFEAFNIPSGSMRSTLLQGDYIVVNKLAYGPRLPITPLSLPFAHQKFYLDWFHLPYLRIPGYSSVQRNDVVVFNYPMDAQFPIDHREHYIKRCIALPGDTLEVDSTQVYVNGKRAQDPEGMQLLYAVNTDTSGIDSNMVRQMGIEWATYMPMKGHYYLYMSPALADSLRGKKNISSVILNVHKRGFYDPDIFPHDTTYKWNVDFYGPIVVPKKGDSVKLSSKNINLYKRIISVYENNKVLALGDSILINGKRAQYYTFKMNYYFMMGDNRHESLDSRFWGFVPEDHIVGRASFILFSSNKEPGRTGRWLKWIR
jgi:signal peptidase I